MIKKKNYITTILAFDNYLLPNNNNIKMMLQPYSSYWWCYFLRHWEGQFEWGWHVNKYNVGS